MTEPKFMQLCRDNPGRPFPVVRRRDGVTVRIARTEDDVWVVTSETSQFNSYVTDSLKIAERFADPKPKPERRFARIDPQDGFLAGDEAGLTFEQALNRVRNSSCYTQVVEVVLYAVNEDGTRGELLYGMPEVE